MTGPVTLPDGSVPPDSRHPPIPDLQKPPGTPGGSCKSERVTGIEPALSAWEADVLPLNYTRDSACALCTRRQKTPLCRTPVACGPVPGQPVGVSCHNFGTVTDVSLPAVKVRRTTLSYEDVVPADGCWAATCPLGSAGSAFAVALTRVTWKPA